MTITASANGEAAGLVWPDAPTRVPYWVFQRQDVFRAEQEKLFRGPYWSYLCLEAEVPQAGDYRATFVGDTPVIVVRAEDGELYGFENRCAHRGALLAFDDGGHGARDFTCVYHAWTYNLQGDLTGVAFQDGIGGKGGMPRTFCLEDHGPRKLRITTLYGLVFGSFEGSADSADSVDSVDDIEDYLGDEVCERIERVLGGRTPVVLGRFTQLLPNNWKLYAENVKDSYHASILHLFFTTFGINRLSQRGGIIVSESGAHHVSYSAIDGAEKDGGYTREKLRSDSEYTLRDPSLLEGFSEVGDDITLQILSVFPGFVLQQIQNSVAVRQILPRGVASTRLNWTYLGFAEDTPQQTTVRLKQSNLVGPAGYVSMEDGCVGGFVQRGIAGAAAEEAVLEMGGSAVASSGSRVTEASVRGFWKEYAAGMGLTAGAPVPPLPTGSAALRKETPQ